MEDWAEGWLEKALRRREGERVRYLGDKKERKKNQLCTYLVIIPIVQFSCLQG
jgi:hypothetical protein